MNAQGRIASQCDHSAYRVPPWAGALARRIDGKKVEVHAWLRGRQLPDDSERVRGPEDPSTPMGAASRPLDVGNVAPASL